MKLLIEVIISLLLHPIAVLLAWINLAGRSDMSGTKKFIWAIVCLVWGLGPILYILVGDGDLWYAAPSAGCIPMRTVQPPGR